MPKDRRIQARPVSCRFCRSRKLRCSREAPCSNCVSRRIRCDLEHHAPASAGGSVASEPELLERIRRLEKLVESQALQQNRSVERQSEGSEFQAQQVHSSDRSSQIDRLDKDVSWLESIYNGQDLSVTFIPYQR